MIVKNPRPKWGLNPDRFGDKQRSYPLGYPLI